MRKEKTKMKIELEIDKTDIVDQAEYADWYLKALDYKRVGPVSIYGDCPVESETNVRGNFDLTKLSIEWDNGDITDITQAMIDNGDFSQPEEDFDVGRFVWGKSIETEELILFGV
jgi:hypothetical protein